MECSLKKISLKFLFILITWTFLMLVIFGKLDLSTKSDSIHRDHSNIETVTDNDSREESAVTASNRLSPAKKVEQISMSTEASTSHKPQPYIHFRDLFNKTYSTHILTGPDNVQDKGRYFIYRCNTTAMERCGGWADRVKGMLAAYLIANLTGREFKLEVILPSCDIRQFIVPNHVNWSLPQPTHKVIQKSNDIQILNFMNNKDIYYKLNTINFMTLPGMKAKYVYFRANLDYMDGFQKSKLHQNQLSWMQTLTRDEINAEVYKRLFKLNPRLQRKLNAFISKNIRPADKLICAQVRTGRNPTIPRDTAVRLNATDLYKIWDFLQNISKGDNSKIFIMADSEDFISRIKQQSFREKLLFSEGKIVHIQRSFGTSNNEKCAGLEKVIFDQFILMHCDTLLVSNSGLGRMAAYIRGSDQDLYCILPGACIVPCKRSKIKELFDTFG